MYKEKKPEMCNAIDVNVQFVSKHQFNSFSLTKYQYHSISIHTFWNCFSQEYVTASLFYQNGHNDIKNNGIYTHLYAYEFSVCIEEYLTHTLYFFDKNQW